MKRFIISVFLVLLATISGTAMSLTPSRVSALGNNAYVSLGDSIATGQGLTPLANGSAEDQACGRSALAYPNYVASNLHLSLKQVACSGAKASQGLYGFQEVDNMQLAPQIDRAFAAGKPRLITITIGANDTRWSQFVQSCYTQTCGTRTDDLISSAYLLHLRWELYVALQDIQIKSGSSQPPRVVFTGYYAPFSSANPTCADATGITSTEMNWLSGHVATLNQTIRDAASHDSFVSYAPVSFSGHELCSAKPWVQGLTANAPFHPTAQGQQAIARALVPVIRASKY